MLLLLLLLLLYTKINDIHSRWGFSHIFRMLNTFTLLYKPITLYFFGYYIENKFLFLPFSSVCLFLLTNFQLLFNLSCGNSHSNHSNESVNRKFICLIFLFVCVYVVRWLRLDLRFFVWQCFFFSSFLLLHCLFGNRNQKLISLDQKTEEVDEEDGEGEWNCWQIGKLALDILLLVSLSLSLSLSLRSYLFCFTLWYLWIIK